MTYEQVAGVQEQSLGTGLQITGLNKVFSMGRRSVAALQDAGHEVGDFFFVPTRG